MRIELNKPEQKLLAQALERLKWRYPIIDMRSKMAGATQTDVRPLKSVEYELGHITSRCGYWLDSGRESVSAEFLGLDALLCILALSVDTSTENVIEAERLRLRLVKEFIAWVG